MSAARPTAVHRRPSLEGLERTESGGEAGRVRIRPREQRAAGDHGEDARGPASGGAPLPLGERGEERRGRDHRPECDDVVPDQGRGEVVEEAVGEERVVARVPERVPHEDAVLDELGAVQVSRQIARRRPEEDERETHDERDRGSF